MTKVSKLIDGSDRRDSTVQDWINELNRPTEEEIAKLLSMRELAIRLIDKGESERQHMQPCLENIEAFLRKHDITF